MVSFLRNLGQIYLYFRVFFFISSLSDFRMGIAIKHPDWARYLSEATGTFFLVLIVGCNVLVMSGAGAISIGSLLMCMIYTLGSVSGANFNPAVTFAILLSGRGKMTLKDALAYMASQMAGGALAGLLTKAIFRDAFFLRVNPEYSVAKAMAVEVIYTMGLCYVVLNVATTASQAGNQYFGLAIGFTVLSAAVAIGTISNCCLNPAVALGSALAALMIKSQPDLTHYHMYFLMPMLGAIFGALAFYFVRRKDEYEPHGLGMLRLSQTDTEPQKTIVVESKVSAAPEPVIERNPSMAEVALTNSDDEH